MHCHQVGSGANRATLYYSSDRAIWSCIWISDQVQSRSGYRFYSTRNGYKKPELEIGVYPNLATDQIWACYIMYYPDREKLAWSGYSRLIGFGHDFDIRYIPRSWSLARSGFTSISRSGYNYRIYFQIGLRLGPDLVTTHVTCVNKSADDGLLSRFFHIISRFSSVANSRSRTKWFFVIKMACNTSCLQEIF